MLTGVPISVMVAAEIFPNHLIELAKSAALLPLNFSARVIHKFKNALSSIIDLKNLKALTMLAIVIIVLYHNVEHYGRC